MRWSPSWRRCKASPAELLQLELLKLQEQMAVLQRRMFGRSSEKSPHTSEPETKKLPRGHGPKAQPQLPIVEQRHELAPCDQTCIICKGQLVRTGDQTEDSEEIGVVHRKFVLLKHKRERVRASIVGGVGIHL